MIELLFVAHFLHLYIGNFQSTVNRENRRLFIDTLKGYNPSLVGTLLPQPNVNKANHAQWLSGIAAGAWFEIYDLSPKNHFRFRRISPYGNIDCDGIYSIDQATFDINSDYEFLGYQEFVNKLEKFEKNSPTKKLYLQKIKD